MTNKITQLLAANRPLVMAILNITPDSFADGGLAFDVDHAVARAKQCVAEGADILDIGGESTIPGAPFVSVEEELRRVIPVIKQIKQEINVPISIDTYKPEVMHAAAEIGVDLINDVRALQEPGALQAVSQLKLPICLMHQEKHGAQIHRDQPVIQTVLDFFAERLDACKKAGIDHSQIILDPGFGLFKRSHEANVELFRNLPQLSQLGFPLLIGISRKSIIGNILNQQPNERLYGSVALNVLGYTLGARIFRVHDVQPTVEALKVADHIHTRFKEQEYAA